MDIRVPASSFLRPEPEARALLFKWLVALLVPLLVFTFVWQGDAVINNVLLSFVAPQQALTTDVSKVIQAAIFITFFYLAVVAMSGYLMASDSGQRKAYAVWIDSLLFAVVPVLLMSLTDNLIIGIALSAFVWAVFFVVRRRIKVLNVDPASVGKLPVLSDAEIRRRALMGSFWLALLLAVIWLLVDIIFFATGELSAALLPFSFARTVVLIALSPLLGLLGGWVAKRYTVEAYKRRYAEEDRKIGKQRRLETSQVVPNAVPLRSVGARNFYLALLLAFLILYPAVGSFFFGYSADSLLANYGDAGYYVILALGLNIVVGFAGLLDLGYVAFFAIGAYTWGIVGSTQLGRLTGLIINPSVLSWLFWPMLIGAALVAAFWGVVLGAPTLRLRGDYLAIVTLGFGEIVPIVVQNMDKYTNGVNGLAGVRSPSFFGVTWSVSTPIPYYYLILALIALVIFANVRLRDSRLGRAWIAIREDEIAAASSGINLRNTKLLAFGAGAFFSGIAGAYHSAKLGSIASDSFSFGDSVVYLAMVVIGGLGSIPGVIVGALAVYSINILILAQLDSLATDPTSFVYPIYHFIIQFAPNFTFGNVRNLIFGIVLVVIMVFRPEGLIPSARRKRELHQDQSVEPELGALDVVPADPAFEQEVRVE